MKTSEKLRMAIDLLCEVDNDLETLKNDKSKLDIFKPIAIGSTHCHVLTNLYEEITLLEKLQIRFINHNL